MLKIYVESWAQQVEWASVPDLTKLIPNTSVCIVIFVQKMKYPYKFIKEDAMEVVLNVEFTKGTEL